MKKITTLLLLSLILTNTIWANPIDPKKAGEIANGFWKSNIKHHNAEELTLKSPKKMAKAGSRISIKESEPQYYIYTARDNNGFVIVSGDDALPSIVGYSTEYIGENKEMPAVLIEWLNEYSLYVDEVRAGNTAPAQRSAKAGKTAIAPMLQTSWDQTAPYNNLCPEISGQKTPTGCTATAMAQIMKFHEWPITPIKAVAWESNITGKTETIDLTKRTYNWSNMLNHYRNGYTAEQAQEVAQLMVDVGKAIQSSYSLNGTGSNESLAANALVNVFDYSKAICIMKRTDFTEDEYVQAIRENLSARRPVLYVGTGLNYQGGHAFVCDGIDANDLLHIDWGWNGAFNGYYDMTYMTPASIGTGGGTGTFNVAQSIIANIAPRGENDVNSYTPGLVKVGIFQPDTEKELYTYTTKFSDSLAKFKIAAFVGNRSHSTLDKLEVALAIKKSDGTYKILRVLKYEEGGLKPTYYLKNYFDFSINSNNYEKGTHELKILYKNSNGEYEEIRSDLNRLMLDIYDGSAKLYQALPDIKVSSVKLTSSKLQIGSNIKFSAEFINKNTYNSTVIVVPIINTTLSDGSITRDTLKNAIKMFEVIDNRNIYVEFDTNNTFKQVGECNITFAYNLSSYYSESTTYNPSAAESITGKSNTFTVSEESSGGSPSVTSIQASDTNNGKTLNITAVVTNKTHHGYQYSATLALVVRNTANNQTYKLRQGRVENLEKDKGVQIRYSSNDYFPTLPIGSYEVMVCEINGGNMERVPQSVEKTFNITENDKAVPYINGITSVCNTKIVAGDSVDVRLTMGCYNGSFDGYIRIITNNSIEPVLKSDHVPVTISEDENIELDIACLCGTKAPMGQWTLIIKYYDKNKREQGTLSNNILAYPNNNYFWVDDGTDIEKVESVGNAKISVNNGHITIADAQDAYVTIYSADGSKVYNGTDNTIPVTKGLYIVTVQHCGTTTATKIFVK